MPAVRRLNWTDCRGIGTILIPYVVLLIAVPPAGEFPTADDFDYAASAWHLADTGQLTLSDWPAMTLVTHVVWGALVCQIGGNSFLALRCGQFLLSCVAALAIYGGFVRRGHARSLAALAAVCFAVNPSTVSLQYTFMTDITGAAFTMVLIAWCPGRDECSLTRLFGYSVLAGLAYLARETAAIPWIVVVAAAAWECTFRRGSWLRLAALLAGAGALVAAYEIWLRNFLGVPFNRSQPSLNWGAMADDPQRVLYIVSGLALGLAPLGCALLMCRRKDGPRGGRWIPAVLGIAGVGLVCAGVDVVPPYRGELFDLGLRAPEAPTGHIPAALQGPSFTIGGNDVSLMRAAATGLAWMMAGVLATAIHGILRATASAAPASGRSELPVATVTWLATAALYLATRGVPDRYLLSLVAIALPALAEQLPPRRLPGLSTGLGWCAAVLIGCAAVLGIQDGMSRSRSFRVATERLLQGGVSPFDIDAGLAFGGMHRFNPAYRGDDNGGPFWNTIPESQWNESTASVSPLTTTDNRAFRVSFDAEPGYRPIDTVPFRSWWRAGEVRVYERADRPAPSNGAIDGR